MELSAELPPAHAWDELGLPAGLGEYLAWAEKNGADELLWSPEPDSLAAVGAALGGRALALSLVLPNMSLYARDAMDSGPTGAVLKRLRALDPASFVRLGLRLLPRVPALLEKRFAAGIMLLADAEYLKARSLPVKTVVLHSSSTDMALALGCRELLVEFRGWARARGVDGACATSNPELWAARTKEWGLGDLAVRTPARAVLPWTDWRPRTPAQRLAAWKARADRHFL